MNFKKIILMMLLLIVITISAVSAADNTTGEAFSSEKNNENLNFGDKLSEITSNYEMLGLNEQSGETAGLNDSNNILSSKDSDVLGGSDSKKLTIKPKKAYSNKKFIYSANLTDNNMPISGKTIKLTIFYPTNEYKCYNAVTNSKGIANFKINPQKVGKYEIYAETDDIIEGSYISVIQNPKATAVKAPKVTSKYKQNKYFKVSVKDYKGKPVNNLKLKLKVSTNKKYKNYYIKTNSKGIATFNTKKLAVGTHSVNVYNADGRYEVSKKSKIVIKANKKTSHYVKVGTYKGKLSDKQYKKLKRDYKNNKNFAHVTINCINKKYHKITVEILCGYNPMNYKYYEKGFYGNVWDDRYGKDGMKVHKKKVKFYAK